MATDGRIVGSQGVQNRDQLVADMKASKCEITSVTLRDVNVTLASADAAEITYRSNSDGTCGGNHLPPGGSFNTSVWARRDGRWLMLNHHQSAASR